MYIDVIEQTNKQLLFVHLFFCTVVCSFDRDVVCHNSVAVCDTVRSDGAPDRPCIMLQRNTSSMASLKWADFVATPGSLRHCEKFPKSQSFLIQCFMDTGSSEESLSDGLSFSSSLPVSCYHLENQHRTTSTLNLYPLRALWCFL